ncbi:hypothetical protein OSCI_1820004 [Kamptonema sp. PCC 6506]|nr:hypothetical protein OSCI_1820004 [Kamptonema sp. PCC 6506]
MSAVIKTAFLLADSKNRLSAHKMFLRVLFANKYQIFIVC